MAKARKGEEYVCGVCGTTLLVTDMGFGVLEDVVCCDVPMVVRVAEPKKKTKAKKKAKKKK